MAHKKGGGAVKTNRDSISKRLGIKKFGGESVITGNIILRQRGAKYKAGKNVGMGRDHTIFSMIQGVVEYGKRHGRTVVNVFTK